MSGNQNGDWAWDSARESGFTYPADAHLITTTTHDTAHRTPRKKQRTGWAAHRRAHRLDTYKLLVTAAILIIIGSLAMAVLGTRHDPDNVVPLSTSATAISAPLSSGVPLGGWPGAFTAPTRTVPIPYTDSGDWRVGTDLPAGRYRVQVTGDLGGYWARCADTACRIGAGLLANATLPRGAAETLLDIAPTDYLIKTAGLRLIPS